MALKSRCNGIRLTNNEIRKYAMHVYYAVINTDERPFHSFIRNSEGKGVASHGNGTKTE